MWRVGSDVTNFQGAPDVDLAARPYNLTQHARSVEQVEAGVRDLPHAEREQIKELITFDDLPSTEEIEDRAYRLAQYVPQGAAVMIGGAPFLMSALERALRSRGCVPVYAFSRRESVDQPQPDGSIRKVSVFRHLGFVRV